MIEEIIESHSSSFPELIKQVSRLKVSKREYTGVGIYVNFDLDSQEDIFSSPSLPEVLGSQTAFYVDSLKSEIAYELSITQTGKLQFLEIVNNDGVNWDGKFKIFKKLKLSLR